MEKNFHLFRDYNVITKNVTTQLKVKQGVQKMKVCTMLNLLTVELDTEDVNSEIRDSTIDIPISIDEAYNLIVCRECGVGLPFEFVRSHLKQNHGITMTREEVMAHLSLQYDAMTFAEANDWIKSTWVSKAVQYIPLLNGRRCNECQYSAAGTRVMRNHFSKNHPGLKMSEHSDECKVQLIFKSMLRKYIQVEQYEDMDIDSEGNSDWKMAIDEEFKESMANIKVTGEKGHGNLRLMNVFIAKTRWDVTVEGKDLKAIVEIAGSPTINSNLHKVILCGRRYIKKTYEALDNGSVIVKRILMSEG